MVPQKHNTITKAERDVNNKPSEKDGYPTYPVEDDIFQKNKYEKNIDPENTSIPKVPNEQDEATENEEDFEEDISGDDLDVPGAELDDVDEAIGSEDEENNYYSLGGDEHNDLDEDDAD